MTGNNKGFTLLEVIIAITIMVLAFASILAVESNSIGATIRAKEMNIVAMLARRKIIDMEYKIEGKTFEEVQKEQGGQFEAPYESFGWKAEVKEIKFPNMTMSAGSSAASGGKDDDSGTQMAEMVTKLVTKYFSKAVREMVVTILWKHDAREQTYSVSTYWVDLNHEFETTE